MKELAEFAEKNLVKKEDKPLHLGEWHFDRAIVMGIKAKTERLNNVLLGYEIDEKQNMNVITDKLAKEGQKVRVSVEYLKQILKLLTKMESDFIEIRALTDHPILFSNEEVEIILAPRISDE